MTEIKYKDITEKIIGASFEVYKFLGYPYGELHVGYRDIFLY